MSKTTTRPIEIHIRNRPGMDQKPFEIVELKGIGHPDSLADGISESVAEVFYETSNKLGLPPYIYSDKVLIVPGETVPEFGGGRVLNPFQVYVPYISNLQIQPSVIEGVVYGYLENTLSEFKKEHATIHVLPRKPSKHSCRTHLEFPAEFEDTGIVVGYAPLSKTERLVKRIATVLTSESFRKYYPQIGEDIKLLAHRKNGKIKLTIACAFIGRLIHDLHQYVDLKDSVTKEIISLGTDFGVDLEVELNPDDRPQQNSIYLTVLGTSAEHGDCGVTGRGNRWNGLISPLRPMTIEAIAGKNMQNHPARLLTHIAQKVSSEIYNEFPVNEVLILISGRVGYFLNDLDQFYIHINSREVLSESRITEFALTWLDRFIKASTYEDFYAI